MASHLLCETITAFHPNLEEVSCFKALVAWL